MVLLKEVEMRKRSVGLTLAAALAIGALTAGRSPGAVLFTTQGDFTGWGDNGSGSLTAAPTSTDLDGSSVNGVGNVGGVGGPGALAVTWHSGNFDYLYSPGEQGNAAFLSALDTTGTVFVDYTTPPPGTGNYFQLQLVLNYANAFDQFSPSSGPVDLGGGVSEQAISYTLSHPASSYSYFQFGVIYNSNYNTSTPFTIDNIHTPAAVQLPEPATAGVLAVVGAAMLARRRARG
jgi:hypothetical protein